MGARMSGSSTGYSLLGVQVQDEGSNLGLATFLDFTGAGVTASASGSVITVNIPGGGGGGAPANAQYLVLSLDATLTDERRFVPAARLSATDAGAGGDYTLDLATVAGLAPGSYTYSSITVDAYGRVTSASSGAAPVASGWTDGGTAVYLTTATDDVSIGNNTPVTNRKLSVYNTGTDLGVSVVTLASTDNVAETFVSGEANARWSVDGAGATRWGAGGASAPDTRLVRSSAGTLALDNNAGGAGSLLPATDGLGNIGGGANRWNGVIANGFLVYPSAGAANASTTMGNQAIRMGAGGASALDVKLSRTAASTFTVDNNGGGAATLSVVGTTRTQTRAVATTTQTGAYAVAAGDDVVFVNPNAGAFDVTLPNANVVTGRRVQIKRITTSANIVTVKSAGGTIDNVAAATGIVLGGGTLNAITVVSDGTNWWIV